MNKLLALALVLSFATVASAEDKKAAPKTAPADKAQMAPPKAAPEFIAATKYFLGSWTCDGKMAAGPWGPEAKETGRLGFKMELNDFFMAVDGDQKTVGTKTPMTMSFRGVNAYDPSTKKFMRTDFDSMGSVFHMSSAGWEGDKMVFTGEGMMMGQKTKVRHTMTKKGDAEFTSAFEVIAADGKASPMGDDVCKKAKK